MVETPKNMVRREPGCGFMEALFGTRPRKVPPVPQLVASKNHHQQRPGNHTTTTAEMTFAGISKPAAKRPGKKPPILQKKPPTVGKDNTRPIFDSVSKSALYSVSQVANVSYTSQLRKEPSFTSSELSVRLSVHGKCTSTDSVYRASSGNVMLPGHLGNLMKKPEISKAKANGRNVQVGNVYGRNSIKKMGAEEFRVMGNEKYKQGRFKEAISLYTEAIGIDSRTASYYSNRSAALIGLGKLVDAVLDCKIAIRIDPSYHRAHYRLATLYLRLGEPEKALCHYKCSGSKADGKDFAKAQAVKAQLGLCSEARKMKDWKKLLKESQFTASLGADSAPQVYAMQAEALLNLHRHEEASSAFQNARIIEDSISIRLFGLTFAAYFLTVQAQVYLASGRFEEAVSAAVRATELESSQEVSKVARKIQAVARARANGNKSFKASKFFDACNVYSEGLEHEPYNSVLLCNRAACRFKLGQFEKAVEDCATALSLRPSYAKARLRRAECNAKLERWEAAIQDYEVMNQENPGDEEVEKALLEARVQLKKRNAEDAKYMKLINSSSSEEFGGFVVPSGEDQRITIA